MATFSAISFAIFRHQPAERFTEFSVLNPTNQRAEFPALLPDREEAPILVKIVNREFRTCHYRLKYDVDGNTSHEFADITLDHGKTWSQAITIPVQDQGFHAVRIFLYIDGRNTPYRELHLWLSKGSDPSTTY